MRCLLNLSNSLNDARVINDRYQRYDSIVVIKIVLDLLEGFPPTSGRAKKIFVHRRRTISERHGGDRGRQALRDLGVGEISNRSRIVQSPTRIRRAGICGLMPRIAPADCV